MKRIAFLLTAALFAQEPTFKVDSKLVIVNVTAKDKSGNLITNLKKDDFRILEDGVPQTISVFELQSLNNELRAPVSFASTAPRTLEERAPVTAPTPGSPIRYQDRRLLALFFDLSSMQPGEQVRAQQA